MASSTASKQAQIAYGADEKKCFLSYLTVDIQKYLREKEDYSGRELLYVGSLIQRKGLDLLLPALAETSEDIHLTIVGEGQERELLTEQAGKLGITDRIRFLGYVEGEPLRELYHQRGCLHPADQRGLFRTRDLRGDVCVASGDLLKVRRRCV